jgi:hypothetical protein
MTIKSRFAILIFCAAMPILSSSLKAQTQQGPLARVRNIKCTFPVMAVGTWGKEKPDVQIKPSTRTLQFERINADEGTAELKGDYGKYDIIVRYSNGYLHFIQSFLDGPLYVTTVMEKTTATGKYMAVHSRHERTDVSLPTFTSSPEQYYGECETFN